MALATVCYNSNRRRYCASIYSKKTHLEHKNCCSKSRGPFSVFVASCRLGNVAGLKLIKPGQILFTIYSKNQTNEPRRHITASVGIAQPKDKSRYGYLSEYDSFGQSQKEAGDYAEDIAAQMLASSLGIPFDIDKSWDEKRQQWTISGKIYKTSNITQSARGNKDGKWTTTFAAAVLVL